MIFRKFETNIQLDPSFLYIFKNTLNLLNKMGSNTFLKIDLIQAKIKIYRAQSTSGKYHLMDAVKTIQPTN